MEKKVLLVDDEVDFVKVNKVALENKGYKVVAAYDEKEALEKALKEKPDVIILDVMLKKKTGGFNVSRELRKYEEIRNTPIIMLTAIRERMDIQEKIEQEFESISGVRSCNTSLMTSTMTLQYDDRKLTKQEIEKILEK